MHVYSPMYPRKNGIKNNLFSFIHLMGNSKKQIKGVELGGGLALETTVGVCLTLQTTILLLELHKKLIVCHFSSTERLNEYGVWLLCWCRKLSLTTFLQVIKRAFFPSSYAFSFDFVLFFSSFFYHETD